MSHAALPLVRLALLVSLLGCAAPGPPAWPADFPFHAAVPHVTIHWRVDPVDGAVTASGILEVGIPDRIDEVRLEAQGLDTTGQVVSRALDWARARSFAGTEPWPFTVRLRATGREDRVVVRVSEILWKRVRAGD